VERKIASLSSSVVLNRHKWLTSYGCLAKSCQRSYFYVVVCNVTYSAK